jgi:hypothetical protein
MQAAIPIHNKRVSPVFDTAQPNVGAGLHCVHSTYGRRRGRGSRVALRCHWRFGCGTDCGAPQTSNLIYHEEVTGDA